MAITHDSPFIGTEVKLNIHIEPIGDITMDDYDFEVEIYCLPNKSIKATKTDMIKVDSNNYIVLVDTTKVGAGGLKCKVIAKLPDGDFPDNTRTEVVYINTGINIIKSL